MKAFILYSRGNICEECGNIGIHNGKPLSLQLDHIDGNSDNNKLDNLKLLCPNCHSQTLTWCSRNFKNSNRSKYNRQWRKRIKDDLGQ